MTHYGTALGRVLSLPFMDAPLPMQETAMKLLSKTQTVIKCMQPSIGECDDSEHNTRMFSSQSVILYQRNPIGSVCKHAHAVSSLLMLCYMLSEYLSPNSSLRVTSGCHVEPEICKHS